MMAPLAGPPTRRSLLALSSCWAGMRRTRHLQVFHTLDYAACPLSLLTKRGSGGMLTSLLVPSSATWIWKLPSGAAWSGSSCRSLRRQLHIWLCPPLAHLELGFSSSAVPLTWLSPTPCSPLRWLSFLICAAANDAVVRMSMDTSLARAANARLTHLRRRLSCLQPAPFPPSRRDCQESIEVAIPSHSCICHRRAQRSVLMRCDDYIQYRCGPRTYVSLKYTRSRRSMPTLW